jgi:hypothetical protein
MTVVSRSMPEYMALLLRTAALHVCTSIDR